MKNIQKQYTDLLEGKMSKANFMRNVRMQFPQHVSPVSSFEDSVKILKGKRILSEAPQGVYGHDPNAEAPKEPGIDQLNYYQVYHGIQYELAKMSEITDENYVKARKKVVDTILKDPDAYKDLQLANFKAVKEMDEDLKMKEVKENNKVDKPNEMKVLRKNVKANTEDTLNKKEKKKAKNGKGIQHMTQTPKGGLKAFETPGKEKVLALKEHILDEISKINPEHEHFGVGARVKKKDGSLVGEITEWDGDTATVKADDGQVHHVQGNVLTKKDVDAKKEESAQTGTTDEWASPKGNMPEDQQKPVDEAKPDEPHSIKADKAIDQSELKFLKNAFAKTPADQIPEKYKKIMADLEARLGTMNENRESRMKSLKERLMKAVKETMFKKGKQSVTASNPNSQSALKQQGYQEIPNTQDVKSL